MYADHTRDEFIVSQPVRIQPQCRTHKLAPEQRTEPHHSQIRRGKTAWARPGKFLCVKIMSRQLKCVKVNNYREDAKLQCVGVQQTRGAKKMSAWGMNSKIVRSQNWREREIFSCHSEVNSGWSVHVGEDWQSYTPLPKIITASTTSILS